MQHLTQARGKAQPTWRNRVVLGSKLKLSFSFPLYLSDQSHAGQPFLSQASVNQVNNHLHPMPVCTCLRETIEHTTLLRPIENPLNYSISSHSPRQTSSSMVSLWQVHTCCTFVKTLACHYLSLSLHHQTPGWFIVIFFISYSLIFQLTVNIK